MMQFKKGQTLRRGSGQSTVEYILVVAAVIAVIIAVTTGKGSFQTKLTNTIDTATSGMEDMAGRLHGATSP